MDMRKMMRQAQQMQEKLQKDLEEMRVSASAGGGVVTATLDGNKELIELKIEPEAVDPDDVEMLQDLITAAINEASRRVEEQLKEKVGGLGDLLGGMRLPGMPG